MSSDSSSKTKMLTSIARPVAHPERYRKQFWMAGTFAVIAVVAYFVVGLLPLILLLVAGAVATRFVSKKRGRTSRSDRSY